MGIFVAQFLASVGRKIDDSDAPPRADDTGRLSQDLFGVLRKVQNLMQEDCVKTRRGEWQIEEVSLNQFDLFGRQVLEFCARYAQHLEAFVERDDVLSLRCKQLCHPSGACADIQQSTNRTFAQRIKQGCLNQLIRAVHLAQIIPLTGVPLKKLFCMRFTRLADRCQFAPVRLAYFCKVLVFAFSYREQAFGRLDNRGTVLGKPWRPQKHPAAFTATFGQTGIAKDSRMTRNARLTLPEDLSQFADRELHRPKQPRNAKPGWISQSSKDRLDRHPEKDIKIFLYV